MSLETVKRYVGDCIEVHRACAAALGISCRSLNLFAVSRAARGGQIGWRGEFQAPSGTRYTYHVHGAGYSFTELPDAREIHFDVGLIDGRQHVQFSVWHLWRYLSSIGHDESTASIDNWLSRLDADPSELIHVTGGMLNYYCYRVPIGANSQE